MILSSCKKKESSQSYTPPPVSGINLQQQMNIDSTINELRKIVSQDPKNLNAWIKLGNILMDTNRYQEAIEAYSTALKLDPKNVNVRVDMGTCYRRIGKPEIAVKEYDRALKIAPRHIQAHRNKGIVLAFDLKKNKEAIKEFQTYLTLSPNAPDAAQIRQVIKDLQERINQG